MSDIKEKNRCPHCGSIIDKHEICLYRRIVEALWKTYKWCGEKGVHEFHTKDVRHLWSQVEYARFGDWVYFGGLVYKKKKGHYGLNMERCDEFFANKRQIPTRVWKDPISKAIEPVDYRFCKDIPNLSKFLNEDGEYIARYCDRDHLGI